MCVDRSPRRAASDASHGGKGVVTPCVMGDMSGRAGWANDSDPEECPRPVRHHSLAAPNVRCRSRDQRTVADVVCWSSAGRRGLITSSGALPSLSTRSAMLPKTSQFAPPRPWLAITTRSG